MTALRVLVAENVGDGRLAETIAGEASLSLAAVASSGMAAIALTQRLRPDAIVMASNIIGVDAFAAAREIMALEPTPIIMAIDDAGASAERARSDARDAGAVASVAMPSPAGSADHALGRARLIDAITTFVSVKLVRRRLRLPGRVRGASRPTPARRAGAIAIGASTGGPSALHRIFSALPGSLDAPVLVTQHISAGFSEGMVAWLDAAGPLRVKVAADGESLRNGTAYFPADDRHLTVTPERTIALAPAPPDAGHRPSVSVMFRSVAERFGSATCAIILTGMGRDGVDGLDAVRRAGGTVYAQDEASCAVFGMPKAAIDAGVVDLILPLDAIARHIARAAAP
jgi:two-component system chemotaxis response regulator CheB